MKLFALDGGVSLRLDLGRAAAISAPVGLTVRQVTRAELETTREAVLECSIAILDEIAPQGWRCYAASADGRTVHRSFVAMRAGRPLLFAVETRAEARGRGAFRATVAHVARALAAEGERALYSSTTRANRVSVRAHLAAGFVVYASTLDPIILGVSLRGLARRIWRRARARL